MNKGQTRFRYVMAAFVLGLVALTLYAFGAFGPPAALFTLPPSFVTTPITGPIATLLQFIGVPNDWMYVPGIIYLFVVPFAGIIIIVYGFLDSMELFNNGAVNIALAVVLAFATIPFGIFTQVVTALFALMGVYSTWAFTFLFFFGVFYVVMDRMHMWGYTTQGSYVGLTREGRFNQLVTLLERMHRDYSGSGIAAVQAAVAGIPGELTSARNDYNAGNLEKANHTLRAKANKTIGLLRPVIGASEYRRLQNEIRRITGGPR